MARRMALAISTGCTSDLKARAKAPLTARSRRCSTGRTDPLSGLLVVCGLTDGNGPDWVLRCCVPAAPARGAVPGSCRFGVRRELAPQWGVHAQVAERQTRCLQVAVSLWAWGFKSPLAHAKTRARTSRFGAVVRLLGAFVSLLSSRRQPPPEDPHRGLPAHSRRPEPPGNGAPGDAPRLAVGAAPWPALGGGSPLPPRESRSAGATSNAGEMMVVCQPTRLRGQAGRARRRDWVAVTLRREEGRRRRGTSRELVEAAGLPATWLSSMAGASGSPWSPSGTGSSRSSRSAPPSRGAASGRR